MDKVQDKESSYEKQARIHARNKKGINILVRKTMKTDHFRE